MNIPPILTISKDQSLLENLKGLASTQQALANYAAAEGNKISALIKKLEELDHFLSSTDQLRDIKQNATSAVQNTQFMQHNLQSHLLKVLEFIEGQSMYDLIPLPANCTCDILAQGAGLISNKKDPCYGGKAFLQKADVAIRSGNIMRSTIKYKIDSTAFCCNFEGISDGLRVDSLGKVLPRPNLASPNVVFITGYGVFTKHSTAPEVIRSLCWFALTIWDYGGKKKQDQFRMMLLTNEDGANTYDSGIIF